MANFKVDAIDRKIISVLQQEGRISTLELAERVGLSATPCSRRIKNLEDSGVISGYSAQINQAALGNSLSVLMSVRLSLKEQGDVLKFEAAIKALPEVTECLLVTGNVDYVLKISVENSDRLKDFVQNKIVDIPYISDTNTMLVLGAIKSS